MEPRPHRWELHPSLSPEEIARTQAALPDLQLPAIVVQLLANRGMTEPDRIRRFLKPPDISECPDPALMIGVRAAVERINRAIEKGEQIVVYGDFDADGVTSTALLTTALHHFGARVEPYVPHRILEGYGLNMEAVRNMARSGANLVITVDCGISNREEALEASRLGLDLIVTDHHHLPDELPEVICINPKQHVDGCEDFEDLAGVGVAYQLVRALVKKRGKPKTLRNKDLLALVAIGTVADIAPLRGANRSLVVQGLSAISEHSLPGLRTMLDFAHVSIQNMDTERIGFVIGPRLNAAGRLDDARTAYRLLMTEDEGEAKELAQKLEAQNRRRQAMMNSVADMAREQARRMSDDTEFIVLHGDWRVEGGNPLGVVGLVASKLADEFGRPALVLAPAPEEGHSRGSARSTPGFDIHDALSKEKELLVHFGGHSAAAGLTIKDDLIEELSRRLGKQVSAANGQVRVEPLITADSHITLADVTFDMLAALNSLAPFGASNPLPLFMAKDVRAVDAYPLRDGAHLKLMLEDATISQRGPIEAIAFRMGHLADAIKRRRHLDILFYIERREWNGDVHLQLRIKDLKF